MLLLSCCCLVLFGGVLPMFLHIWWVFHSRKCLAKILFFLGLFLKSLFGGELLFLLSCCRLVFFGGVLSMLLHICFGFFIPENAWQKLSSS